MAWSAPACAVRTALALAALLAPSAPAQDPFAPSLRWTRAATNLDAWLPRSLAFGAGGELVWCSATGSRPHVELLAAHAGGLIEPLARDDQPASALSVLSVSAGSERDALFTVAQYPAPDAQHRRTRVTRHGCASGPGTFAPQWSVDLGRPANGPARMACDELGTRVFVAAWNDVLQSVELDVLDGASGAVLATQHLAALGLSELAVSQDGSCVALTAGLELYVCDAGARLVHHEPLTQATRALALSRDGGRLAVGAGDALRILVPGVAGHVLERTIQGAAGELAVRVDLAPDGDLAAIGWWESLAGEALRLEAFDLAQGLSLWSAAQPAGPGGLQNLPEVVEVSADGRRIALGAWGNGVAPELTLYERGGPTPVFSADLPGSVSALALDGAGRRLAVGHKNTHANQFATTGQFRLYDTGESDLTLLATPRVGGTLELAARRAGASEVLFLFGRRSYTPLGVGGTAGTLWLRRPTIQTVAVAADASGAAELSRAIPNLPHLIGARWHVQAAFRIGGVVHFSETVLDPLLF